MLTATLYLLAPEIVLVAVAVSIYLAGAFFGPRVAWRWIALGAVVLAGACLLSTPASSLEPQPDVPLQPDALASHVRWVALAAGALLVLVAWRTLAGSDTPEYLGSLLLIVAGVMVAASARDLVLLFVGLELVSIPTYILLYLGRRDAASQEAAVKYFYLSILASAALLYGFSFLYGAAGSMDLGEIRARLMDSAGHQSIGLLPLAAVGLVLVLAGLGFRIAAVPFHFYAPDVYQGTTHANSALLSVAPKIAGLIALVRVMGIALAAIHSIAWPIVVALAVLTMTLGNVVALWQNNLRRLLAYSSIAHAGYMLIGLAVLAAPRIGPEGQWTGLEALLFYLATYAAATIGAFAALACLGHERGEIDGVDELAGLAWTGGPVRPVLAWLIALLMLSLAGIPPLVGFWGKLAVFASALSLGRLESHAQPWFVALAVIGVVNSAIGAAYYLRVVGTMFFRMPLGTPPTRPDAGGALAAAVACAALVVVLGLLPGLWLGQAEKAARDAVAGSAPASVAMPRAAANWGFGSRHLEVMHPTSDFRVSTSGFRASEPRTPNPEP
jgi:NADH-quinone oxidoreductase subunit N